MKILGIAALALMLTACGGNQNLVTEEKRIVVMPPEGLWECPDLPVPPTPAEGIALTQAEVADYILQLYQNQKVCKAALDNVRAYLIDAKKITDEVEDQ